jgi:hypothetical protein
MGIVHVDFDLGVVVGVVPNCGQAAFTARKLTQHEHHFGNALDHRFSLHLRRVTVL